jgi:hypothetical protein
MNHRSPLPSAGGRTPYWLHLWVLLLLVPACYALVAMPPMLAAVALTLSFGLPAAVWLGLHAQTLAEFPAKLPGALRFGAGLSITALGLGGTFAFSAPLGGAVLAAYVATDALMFRRSKTPAAAAAGLPVDPVTADPAPFPASEEPEGPGPGTSTELLRAMTATELCRAWRASFVELEHARDPRLRTALVQTRQLLLDEIEARHPAGLQAWLASGARAAGGPDRFIDPTGGRGSPEAA